jgi:hypothetical protein
MSFENRAPELKKKEFFKRKKEKFGMRATQFAGSIRNHEKLIEIHSNFFRPKFRILSHEVSDIDSVFVQHEVQF